MTVCPYGKDKIVLQCTDRSFTAEKEAKGLLHLLHSDRGSVSQAVVLPGVGPLVSCSFREHCPSPFCALEGGTAPPSEGGSAQSGAFQELTRREILCPLLHPADQQGGKRIYKKTSWKLTSR